MTFFHKYWQRIDVLIKKSSLSSSSSLSLLLFHPNSESRISDRIRKAKTKKKMMKLFKSQSLNTSVCMCICDSRTKILHFFIDNSEIFFFLLSSWRFDSKKKKSELFFIRLNTHTLLVKKYQNLETFFSFFFGCLQYDFGCWFLCYWIIIIMVFIRFYRFDWLSLFCVCLGMIHPSLPLSTNCVCCFWYSSVFVMDFFSFCFVCFWLFRNRILFFMSISSWFLFTLPLSRSLTLTHQNSFIHCGFTTLSSEKKSLTMKPAKK